MKDLLHTILSKYRTPRKDHSNKVLLNWANTKHIHFLCCVSCKANYLSNYFEKLRIFFVAVGKIIKGHLYILRKGSVNCSKQVLCWNCMYGINPAEKNIALYFGFNSGKSDICILTCLRTCYKSSY